MLNRFIQGDDLARMRKRTKLSTAKAANLLGGVTRKTVDNWESDIGRPDINQFIRLCITYQLCSVTIIQRMIARNSLVDELDLDGAELKNGKK